ncbi:ATP-binding cassette domain-containing protein [Saccharicrinis aurantiacus]|uniref:ATP-binding cassette domain-containing protein n=1 Tax=Saccharicrinis aurantiacus TaxID=1849719 RepID=UPI000838FFB9|nr:ATP-binding cassette domain-containing protein [Saccharicrinis aurantiacus]
MVEINKLSKKYNNCAVFDNFSHSFSKGINGIIGKNGAGKSTLFNCIFGTEKYEGIINRSSSISYLPSNLYFYPRIRGIEYIEFICGAKKQKVDYTKLEHLNSFLKLPLKKYAANYSTGMKQKLALLSFYLSSADILLLDEPFNGLDIEAQHICSELMFLLKKQYDTIIISSHITSQLTNTCDKIFYLNNSVISNSYQKNNFHLIEDDINASFTEITDHIKNYL